MICNRFDELTAFERRVHLNRHVTVDPLSADDQLLVLLVVMDLDVVLTVHLVALWTMDRDEGSVSFGKGVRVQRADDDVAGYLGLHCGEGADRQRPPPQRFECWRFVWGRTETRPTRQQRPPGG